MRVLIIRLGAFGDIVHTLPLAADLAQAGISVGWLCEDRWSVIVNGSPAISTVHRLPRQFLRDTSVAIPRRLLAFRRLIREVRGHRYDVVIDAQGLAKSALLSALSGSARRIGHARPRSREFSWLVSKRKSIVTAEHVIDQQRALGMAVTHQAPAGEWQFPLPNWEAEKRWADQWLSKRGISGAWILNVGAGWPTKVWPKGRQVEFVAALARRRQPLVLAWGSHEEHDLAEEIMAEAEHGMLAPPTTIPQLAGLMSAARLVVSGDTGPLHLARALGTPAVGLFGPVRAERNGPRGSGYRNLQAPGAAWERHDVSKVDMGALSAEQVIEQAASALADRLRARVAQ
jgi:heptosyltransferase I